VPPTLPQAVCKHEFILLSHYVQSIASPAAAWQLRYSFIFLVDEMQSRQMKMKRWASKAVAAASYNLMIEVY
jgi:hypothetical protein